MKTVFFFVWTFPMSLFGWLNRKQLVGFTFGWAVYEYRWWFRGYAVAMWPYILVPHDRSAPDGGNRHVDHKKLMHHEAFHLEQQKWFGPTFLPLYLLAGLIALIVSGLQLKKGHRWNLFEIWARWVADRRTAILD